MHNFVHFLCAVSLVLLGVHDARAASPAKSRPVHTQSLDDPLVPSGYHEISPGQYAASGILSIFPGFGWGQFVQGRAFGLTFLIGAFNECSRFRK